jgi:hypothetical protein
MRSTSNETNRRQINQSSIDLRHLGFWGSIPNPEKSVASTRDPALAIWQAMKPLAEVHARTDAPHIAKILAEAEVILFGLVLALIRHPEVAGPIVPAEMTRALVID